MTYFTGEDQPSTEDFLAKVVQEKGEQWKDPSTLAKGYVAAQDFIKKLQQEKDELLQDLRKQDYAKEVLDTLKQPKTEAKPVETQIQTDPVDLKALIRETITSSERENTARQNLKLVDQKLGELFGTEASATVESKRLELGLSKEKLQEIASESPSAFLRLIGDPETKQDNRTLKGSLNTASSLLNQSTSTRNFAYYQQIRKTNPSQYHSPSMRAQMEKDRMQLGDKFY